MPRSEYPKSMPRAGEKILLIRNEARHGSAIPRRTLTVLYDSWQRVAPTLDPLYYALAAGGGKVMGYWKCLAQQQKDELTELKLRKISCEFDKDADGIAYFEAKLNIYGPLLSEPNQLVSPFPASYAGSFVLAKASEDNNTLIIPLPKELNLKAVAFTHVKAKKIKLRPDINIFNHYEEYDLDSADDNDDLSSQVSLATRAPHRNLHNPVYEYGAHTNGSWSDDSAELRMVEALNWQQEAKNLLMEQQSTSGDGLIYNRYDNAANQPGSVANNTVSILRFTSVITLVLILVNILPRFIPTNVSALW